MQNSSTGGAMVKLAYSRQGREHSQAGRGGALKAANIFDAASVWGDALLGILGDSVDGVTVTRDDVADALRLCALKLKAGDTGYVFESLLGQSAMLERLLQEAARGYEEAKYVEARAMYLRELSTLHKLHMKVLGAIASIQANAGR